MARDTKKTPTPPDTTEEPGKQDAAKTPAIADAPAAKGTPRARRAPRRTKPKAAETPEAPEAVEAAETPAPETETATSKPAGTKPADTGVVVEGRNIRHEDTETILHPAGIIALEASDEDDGPPVIVTTVETVTMEGASPFGSPQDLGAADVIVDMLNGLAEASGFPEAQPDATGPEVVEMLGGEMPIPFWYVMVHQVEDAEQAAAKRRKAGKMTKKLSRQAERAAGLLHDIFEAATETPGILAAHERHVARLIALLEVTPPADKTSQQVFADILRAERRALAKAIKGK